MQDLTPLLCVTPLLCDTLVTPILQDRSRL